MSNVQAFIGLDVHKESISVAVAEAGRGAEVRSLGSIAHTDEAVAKLVRRLTDRHGRLEFVHEAGPCGYGLHRKLEQLGQVSHIVAPSRIPRQPSDRIKNDTRDAVTLAIILRAGEVEPVWIPDTVHEATRDLVRASQAASLDVGKARQRVQSFLLKHGRRYQKKPWSRQHQVWLANQSFEHAAQQIALEGYLRAHVNAVSRRSELGVQIRC